MNKVMISVCAVAALVAGIVVAAENTENNTYKGVNTFDTGSKVNLNGYWAIDGTEVTASAANLNSGVASSTASLVSNAVLKVYGSNIVMVSGGNIDFVLASNITSKVFTSNLVVTAGGTVTVPAASIAPASLLGGKSGVFTNGFGGSATTTVWVSSGVITNWVTTAVP